MHHLCTNCPEIEIVSSPHVGIKYGTILPYLTLLHEAEAAVCYACMCCVVQLFQKIDFGTYFVYHNELLVVSLAVVASVEHFTFLCHTLVTN